MSLDALNAVWKHSEQSGAQLLLLLAIADNANDDGFAFPSYKHLAAKSRMSKRTVQRAVSKLLDTDELSLNSSGTWGSSNVYAVNLAVLRAKPNRISQVDSSSPPAQVDTQVDNSGGHVPDHGTVRVEPSDTEPTTSAVPADDDGSRLFDVPATEVPESELDAKVQTVWDYYFAKLGDRLSLKTLSDSRKKRLKAALKAAGEDTEALCRAIDGFIRYRSSKPGSMTLDDIFSSRPGGSSLTELIEFWISQADDSPTMSAAVPAALRDRVNRRRLQIVEALKLPDDSAAQERAREAVDWLRINANEGPVIEGQQVVRWERIP